MPKKEYTSLPINYPVCEHSSCPMAATCLHQVAYSMMMEQNEEYLRLINPTRCSKDETCTYYRDKKPVIFAKGFTNFQKRMYPQQYDQFMTTLILHFGRNQYFKRRRGDILLPPEEQEVIRLMLEKVGADSKNGLRQIRGTHQLECLIQTFKVPCQYHISVTTVSVT